jgi:hypothetical protein
LLKKDVVWTWSENAKETFNTFKEKFSEFPILRRPDFSKIFILHTDWNAFSISVILGQLDEEGKNMLSPMHPETTRLKTITFHTKGSVLLLYGLSYISGLIFMAPSSF